MKNSRVLSLLGLCRASGSLESGEERCETAIRSGKACLVILSEDASGNTSKKFHDKCVFYEVPLRSVPYDKETLGKAVGMSQRSCMAITNEGLAAKLTQEINQMMGE